MLGFLLKIFVVVAHRRACNGGIVKGRQLRHVSLNRGVQVCGWYNVPKFGCPLISLRIGRRGDKIRIAAAAKGIPDVSQGI